MPDFDDTRKQLNDARTRKERAADAVRRAKDALKQVAAAETELARAFDARNRTHVGERERLRDRREELERERKSAQSDMRDTGRLVGAAVDRFAEFSDPRNGIAQWKDDLPILLLPVRLETRFKDVDGRRELWVRVYPDECSIDTFEPTLSKGEIKNARRYWTALWQAGGIEDQERAAWRGLVASHGSGRAAWIVENYRPLNFAAKPVKPNATDILLAISTEMALGAAQEIATAAFWRALWLADGDPAPTSAALAALETTTSAARAAEIIEAYRPANFDERPQKPWKKTEVNVRTVFVVLPPADPAAKEQSWTRAPKVAALPDRFVFLGYPDAGDPVFALGGPVASPLIAGPDPSADPADQLQQKDGEMLVPEEMKWMFDFDRAVDAGMGFRIPLEGRAAAGGFRRVFVVGLRLSSDESEAQQDLETLLQNHQRGRSGFSLLPQGVPTNNTESGGAGFTRGDDTDASYDDLFKNGGAHFTPTADWLEKKDGQWLAEALGIDAALLAKTRHSGGSDQREARAMNAALWPGTIGYWMETMMKPAFSDETVRHARDFFTGWVSGRGAIPAMRIGKQPYGILPATAYSRMTWMNPRKDPALFSKSDPFHRFLAALKRLLRLIDADWAKMAASVGAVGRSGDPHKTLLDIVGLHSGAVSYAQRHAESSDVQVKLASFIGPVQDTPAQAAMNLLSRLGYAGDVPDLLHKAFHRTAPQLNGPLIDDRPLSETEPIRAYTPSKRNYLEWLIDAARTSLDAVRMEEGFTDGKAPGALLYLLLRYAIEQGFGGASLDLYITRGLLTLEQVKQARSEPTYIHVKASAAQSESRYALLYKPEPAITGDANMTVGEFIARSPDSVGAASDLPRQLRALEVLKNAPTARLERAFAEHLDCCSYRFDAWQHGLLHYQLASMRNLRDGSLAAPRRGIYLGAYAWLEDVRPENKTLTPVRDLEPELNGIFNKPGEPPLERDDTNLGYIHAPSLNQAVTAAVLRNGFQANASKGNPKTMAVNLTSERVRRALGVLEGIRNGQSLGALLGYQFERGLHDRHALAEVDGFIFELRRVFPLRARQLKSTQAPDDTAIEAIEARNVLDGLKLAERVRTPANAVYPFGFTTLPAATAAQKTAIDAEVARLLDTHDAVADLALAEGVHQAVQGNYDRAAGTLDAYSRGNFPPEPDVVRTPTNGVGLTHRVALHLEPGLAAPAGATPRAQAEPALDKWLASVLPPLGQIGCKIVFRAAAGNVVTEKEVTLGDLGLRPLDWVYLFRDESGQAMSELDDRIVRRTIDTHALRPDGGVSIRYMEKIVAPFSVFEALPFLRALRPLALSSRPLRPSDLALSDEASAAQDAAVSIDVARIAAARTAMQTVRGQLAAFQATLEAPVLASVDNYVQTVATRFADAACFGLAQAGWGFAYDWRQRQFIALLKKADELATRWTTRLAEYDAAIAAIPPAAADAEKLALLQSAERLISTVATLPLPATPAAFAPILAAKRTAFVNKRDAFTALKNTALTGFTALLAAVQALLPITDFDLTEFPLAEIEKQPELFVADALAAVKAVIAELDRRLASSQAKLDAHAATTAALKKVEALQAAAKALFGDEFVVIPEFPLTPARADEIANAVAASDSLLDYVKALPAPETIDFPVDEWLYGAARVREKMRAWEQLTMLTGAFGLNEPRLEPTQFPFQPDDDWLALPFPPGRKLDRDQLLYTAHRAVAFSKAASQCGLLLDEWNEVIPGPSAMTGLTFHHDRPNSEPPQTMLLVLPTDFRGAWQWADVVDALHETLDLAAKRAVEPDDVATSAYGALLPATITAATQSGLTISTDFARNNFSKIAIVR